MGTEVKHRQLLGLVGMLAAAPFFTNQGYLCSCISNDFFFSGVI